jgi:TP901 family phage tail tape measure protein
MVEFRIDVIINPRGAAPGAKRVRDELDNINDRANRLRNTILGVFGGIVSGSLITAGVRSLAAFSEAMATVRAVSGATGQAFEDLKEKALSLGTTTRFTATAAAESLLNLSRAGFSGTEALEAVSDTLVLATAGGLGLSDAADIAATSLRGFRLQATQMGRVADVLADTANKTNTSVQELGDALKFVAPIAASVGISFESTNAALGILSDAGLKASLAGTGLKRILSELEGPTTATRRVLESLGISAAEVSVSQVGLTQALTVLKDAGVDAGLALEIFGDRGGPAFEVLANQIPKLTQLTDRLDKAGGSAKRTAADIDNSLNGALLRSRAAIEGFVLRVGELGANSALTKTFNAVSAVFQFFARNIEITTQAALGLAAAFATKLIPLIGSLVVKFATLNPLLALGAAAIALVSLATAGAVKETKLLQEIFENLEKDAALVQTANRLTGLQRDLNQLNRVIGQNGEATDEQRERVKLLTSEIARRRGQIVKEVEDYKKIAAARDLDAISVQNTLRSLDREIERRRAFSRESQVQIDLEERLQELLKAGVVPNTADIDAIQGKLELNQLLSDQRGVLEEIRGPQEEANRKQEALNALLAQGTISLGEYNAFLSRLGDNTEKAVGSDPFAVQVESLREAIELESVRAQQGELVASTLQIEQQLRREGIQLTGEQAALLTQLVEEQRRVTQAAAQQASIDQLGESLNYKRQLVEEELRLQELLRQQPLLHEEINRALDGVRLQALQSSTDLADGFSRAFLRMKMEAEDFASVGDRIVTTFADKATDAIFEFTRTGEFAFKQFAVSVLEEITKVLIRLLVVQAISAALGLSAPAGVATTNSLMNPDSYGPQLPEARAAGGPVTAGRSYMVGEEGPELFQPGRSGRIVPNGQSGAAPQVNVQVVNVDDPSKVPQAITNGEADEAIINALARNKDRVSQVIR